MTPGLLIILGLAWASLLIGSLVRMVGLQHAVFRGTLQPAAAHQRRLSLGVWWVLMLLFSGALLAGKLGLSVLFCTASLIGIVEFQRIFSRSSDSSTWPAWMVVLVAVAHFACIALIYWWWLPLATTAALFTGILVEQIVRGQTSGYLRTTAGYFWISMLLVVGLSHAVALAWLPVASFAWNAGVVGWTLFLVLLTELNDIAQALIGRMVGRHKLSPTVSPGKTWEGWLGGLAVTSLLAMLLAVPLTTFLETHAWFVGLGLAGLSGLLISMAGLLGDLNISALKREVGMKDSSRLLPGMGGMLDRIDSLTLTAPAFYYFARVLG